MDRNGNGTDTPRNSNGNTIRLAELQVKKPNNLAWIVYFTLVLALNLGIYYLQNLLAIFILATIVDIVIVPIIWGKCATGILRRHIYQRLETQGKAGPRLLASLLGLNLGSARSYFLEGRGKSVDLNSVGLVFRQRIFDVISSCIGLGFLIALTLRYAFGPLFVTTNSIMGMAIIILFFMPPCVFWFVPLIWTLKDADVRALDGQYNISNLGDEIKTGFLRKLLGVTAIITGVGFFTDLGPAFWAGKPFSDTVLGMYAMSVVFVVILICSIGGAATLITLIYLLKYHARNVNRCRCDLAERLPVKYTQVSKNLPPESA